MSGWRRESAPSPSRTLLNRELSHLEFHARVLELATDETLPLLERVKFCANLLVEPRRVLPGPRRRPARTGRSGHHRPLGRRPDAAAGARSHPRARARAVGTPVTALEARASPGARRRRDHGRRYRGSRAEGAREARTALPSGDLPGADTARGRPRPAVPVHLRALALARDLRRGPGDGRGALRAREDSRGTPALLRSRRPRPLRPARADHRPLPAGALPRRRRSSSARCSG